MPVTKEELCEVANSQTPSDVTVPATWGGLIVWALGKWGIGVVFLFLLIPVYQDMRHSYQELASISTSNVKALEALAARLDASNATIQRLDDAIRRLEINRSKADSDS